MQDIKQSVKNKKLYPQWLKNKDVEKIFGLSPTTLHRLRSNGKLPYTKLQGTIYYSIDDLNKLLENNKKDSRGHE
ncbi:MAG: helix-turn-helix domain-containing protein [Candidatus Woesearchaeota archaeon]